MPWWCLNLRAGTWSTAAMPDAGNLQSDPISGRAWSTDRQLSRGRHAPSSSDPAWGPWERILDLLPARIFPSYRESATSGLTIDVNKEGSDAFLILR